MPARNSNNFPLLRSQSERPFELVVSIQTSPFIIEFQLLRRLAFPKEMSSLLFFRVSWILEESSQTKLFLF